MEMASKLQKRFCGDPVAEALRAIGRRRGDCDPVPGDFTEEERFRMFKAVMHGNVWPATDFIDYGGRLAFSWTYSVRAWRHGGKRKFAERVRWAASLTPPYVMLCEALQLGYLPPNEKSCKKCFRPRQSLLGARSGFLAQTKQRKVK